MVDAADIFADPFALTVLGSDGGEMPGEPDNLLAAHYRAFMAYRSRLADDALAAARARGLTQAVVLGAGLDTTGLRHAGLRVFEVDKPAMQSWKQSHFRRLGLTTPASLTYVPVNFETDSLPAKLAQAGFSTLAPAFFIWLGVVPYLTLDAITDTLSFAARSPGAEIVFDYSEPPETLSPAAREAYNQRSQQVAQLGEPWISHFEPATLATLLHATGFTTIRDHDRAALMHRYPTPRLTPPRTQSGAHVMHALRA